MGIPLLHRTQKENPQDTRSGRIVAVIHCVLNQNARDPGAAVHAGASEPLVSILLKHRVGILQMPCPEMTCLGLPRSRPKGLSLRSILDTPWGRSCCRSLSRSVADQMEEHARAHHKILAILGGDVESPGCAVHFADGAPSPEGKLSNESGVFMKALESELRTRGLHVPFLAMRESSPGDYQGDLARLELILSRQ